MENVKRKPQDEAPITSIASYKLKHLSRLYEAALKVREQIHTKCDALEREMKKIKAEYDSSLQDLRKLQAEVDTLEHKILMENVNKRSKHGISNT